MQRVPTDETAGLADDVVAALEGEYPESLRGLGELGHAAPAGLQEFDVQRQKAELDDAPLVGVVRRQLVERGHQLVSREAGRQGPVLLALQQGRNYRGGGVDPPVHCANPH